MSAIPPTIAAGKPIVELGEWSPQLCAIAVKPRQRCPDFLRRTRKHEAWPLALMVDGDADVLNDTLLRTNSLEGETR